MPHPPRIGCLALISSSPAATKSSSAAATPNRSFPTATPNPSSPAATGGGPIVPFFKKDIAAMGPPPVAAGDDGVEAAGDDGRTMALVQIAEAFSPRVQAEENHFYLDLGHPRDEEGLGQALWKRAREQGLKAGVGIAANKLVARLAARRGLRAPVIVKRGEEARFLAPWPLEALEPSEKLAQTLARWGLRTLGDLARLPSDQMITHLGKEGWELQQSARGIDLRPFVPCERTPVFLEKIDFGWPVCELSPFLAAAQPSLERLMRGLALSGLACQRLELSLELDNGRQERRSIRLRAPTRELKTLARLLQDHLSIRPPAAPLSGLTLIAHPETPREAQLSLFGPASLSPVRLATTLAQLSALLGEERLGSPVASDGYRPERWALKEYDAPPAPLFSPLTCPEGPPLAAIRVLRPPVRLEVTLADPWPREPVRLRSIGSSEIAGEVRAASGPWRMEDRWWADDGILRDYWDVELKEGTLYRIFQDRKRQEWWADGLYD